MRPFGVGIAMTACALGITALALPHPPVWLLALFAVCVGLFTRCWVIAERREARKDARWW